MEQPPKELGIPQEMEFTRISEEITKAYISDVGSIVYYRMLSLVDQMVRDANPDNPHFHVRFAKALFQGVQTPGGEILPQPSQSDIRRLKFLLEKVTGTKANPSFDETYFPRKVDVNSSYTARDFETS